ncbi:unnamed protein product [Didymodactylos carnosus]|uniref:DDE-1 domain-containing protein n=1 Tax=Didymodactylos carnosus TaxID=1234261 RepID=A0A8S2ENC5_9BILA|nr:unnamed protein product [Didymodactylos carnosus]CAF4037806.1 unnamed protein product [Didymodactylos carnosus]
MAVSIARTHECDGYDRGLSTAFSTAVRTYVSEYFKENTIIITAVIVKRTIYLHERLLDQSNILFDVNILLEELKSIQTFTVPSSTKVRPSSDSDEICRRILLIQSCVTLKTDLYDLDQMGKTSRFLGNTMYDRKLTSSLVEYWIHNVLKPAVGNEKVLLLLDVWGGQTDQKLYSTMKHLRLEIIPKKTTSMIQPLDITFNRQYKHIIRTIYDHVRLYDINCNLSQRNNIIKLTSFKDDEAVC